MDAKLEQARRLSDYLAIHEKKDLLRFLTCGSVDDGKSTLIGRLLYDTKLLFEDQLATLTRDSKKFGTVGDDVDFALLVDGLDAEREQGITIDVAYRFFTTDRRKFIVADTPGHEQYTRNMATGASSAEVAILLIDARKGVLPQTRRHSFVVSLLGIKHVVLAVNKIDLVGFSKEVFDKIVADYASFASPLGFKEIVSIPLSARFGDNVILPSPSLPWFSGPTLLDYLERVDVARSASGSFRMPVQWVNRPHLNFRGFAGSIVSGKVSVGDEILVANSGRTSQVAEIITQDGTLPWAAVGQAVTITVRDDVDISRGDVLTTPDQPVEVADQFSANVIWMNDDKLVPGRTYLIKVGTKSIPSSITRIKHKVDINTGQTLAAASLSLNEIGVVQFATDAPIPFEPYAVNRELGGFIVIDRVTNQTLGAGMITFGLRRASNIHWQTVDVTKRSRARSLSQSPVLLWFTGVSASGKSTVANLVEKRLHALGKHTYLLDGDNLRHGLSRDLGFTEVDRVENMRRAAETGKILVDAGLIVLAAFISPFRSERDAARASLEPGEFLEVFVNTPLEIAERRDPKGLYAKARRGELSNFTGIDSPYEPPLTPEIELQAGTASAEQLCDEVIQYLEKHGYLN